MMKLYMIVFSLLLTSILIISSCDKKEENQVSKEKAMMMTQTDSVEQVIYYTCPMPEHKHVYSKEPGECPECKMKLVAGVVTDEAHKEYYGCPMLIHSHVRSDSTGTCPECGMKLKPMRLVKDK